MIRVGWLKRATGSSKWKIKKSRNDERRFIWWTSTFQRRQCSFCCLTAGATGVVWVMLIYGQRNNKKEEEESLSCSAAHLVRGPQAHPIKMEMWPVRQRTHPIRRSNSRLLRLHLSWNSFDKFQRENSFRIYVTKSWINEKISKKNSKFVGENWKCDRAAAARIVICIKRHMALSTGQIDANVCRILQVKLILNFIKKKKYWNTHHFHWLMKRNNAVETGSLPS